jgi:hypothetical protein
MQYLKSNAGVGIIMQINIKSGIVFEGEFQAEAYEDVKGLKDIDGGLWTKGEIEELDYAGEITFHVFSGTVTSIYDGTKRYVDRLLVPANQIEVAS